MAHRALVLVLALTAGAVAPIESAFAAKSTSTLRVFAAASLAEAFEDVARMLEKKRPGLDVRMNLAGSQQLAAQIEQGAGADLFASADTRWMDYVKERGLLAGEPVLFVRNRLVVIVPATNPARIQRLQDLSRGGVKLVLGADAVPVGRYSRTALAYLARDPAFGDDYATRTLRNLVSEEESVRSVVGKVQLGEADAGIVYRSDVTKGVARYVRVLEIPEEANVVAAYPIAQVRGVRSPEVAQAFVDLLLSPEGQQVLERHGFIRVASAP